MYMCDLFWGDLIHLTGITLTVQELTDLLFLPESVQESKVKMESCFFSSFVCYC